jgi:type I restriction enzyme S subunit
MNAIIETFKNASSGSVFNTIIVDTFKFLDFTVPNSSLIKDFESKVSPIYDSVLNLQSQNQRLRESRDLLLPRLMMGMIEV